MPFCIKCKRKIGIRKTPWCDNCRIAIYQETKKVSINKNKNMDEPIKAPETEPETPEEEPTEEAGEEETEESTEAE